jgi:hypothetical protein
MTEQDITTFDNLSFDVEVSTWYHEFRRGLFTALVTIVRLVSLLGSVAALLAISSWVEASPTRIWIITIASVAVGIVNLFDLVFQFDTQARDHTSLYQRFKSLQAKMARGKREWEQYIDSWAAEAQSIRVDEPPTYWALFNMARNQALEKHGVSAGNARRVSRRQRLLGYFKHYRPEDFVAA